MLTAVIFGFMRPREAGETFYADPAIQHRKN
jgi:hypothetical protein